MPETRATRRTGGTDTPGTDTGKEESRKKKSPVIVIGQNADLEKRGIPGVKGHGLVQQRKRPGSQPGPKSKTKQRVLQSSSSSCFVCGGEGQKSKKHRPSSEAERMMVKTLLFMEDVQLPKDEREWKAICESCGQVLSNLRDWRREVDHLLAKIKKVSFSVKELYRRKMSESSTSWTLRSGLESEEDRFGAQDKDNRDDPVFEIEPVSGGVVIKEERELGSGSDAMECPDFDFDFGNDDDEDSAGENDEGAKKKGSLSKSEQNSRSRRARKRPARFGLEGAAGADTDSDEGDSKRRKSGRGRPDPKKSPNKEASDFTFDIGEEDEEEEDEKTKRFCSDCSELFGTRRELLRHRKIVHDNYRKWTCELCNKDYVGTDYNRHVAGHHRWAKERNQEPPPLVYVCDINDCTATFSDRQEVTKHKRSEHLNAPSFQCQQCNKYFFLQRKYDIHMMQHQGVRASAENAFVCELCGINFASLKTFRVHQLAQHEKQVRFKCEECGKGFYAKYNYRAHLESHKSKEEKLTCSFCQEKFLTILERKSHERLIHQGKPVHVCPQCGKECLTTFELNSHLSAHNGEKRFACVCGELFSRNKNKSLHIERGVCKKGTLPTHKCSCCNKCFATMPRRKAHEWKEHKEEIMNMSSFVGVEVEITEEGDGDEDSDLNDE